MRGVVPFAQVAGLVALLAGAGCRLDRTGLTGSPGLTGAGGIPVETTGAGGGAGAGGGGASGGGGVVEIEAGAPDAVVAPDAAPPDPVPPDAGPRPCGGGNGGCGSLLEFCERPDGVCDGDGVCVAIPLIGTCPTAGPRVCGCDDHVYLNDCFRQQARQSKQALDNCN